MNDIITIRTENKSTGLHTLRECSYCGQFHTTKEMCPKVKSIEYYPNGMIKKVELK